MSRLHPWALAVAGGLAIYLSQPPARVWPLVFLAPLGVLLALREAQRAWPGSRLVRPFTLGLVTGIAGYGPMLVWVVQPAGWLGWVLLVLVQAAFVGVFAVLIRPWLQNLWVIGVAPVLWTGMEAWRGMVPLRGFDWGSLAYAHVSGSWMLSLARLLGERGVIVATVLISALAYAAYMRAENAIEGLEGSPLERIQAGLPHAQPVLIGLAAAGLATVLATIEPPAATGETIDVLAIQGNDLEGFRGTALEEDRTIAQQMLSLTRDAVADDGVPDLTVWPESSIDRDPTTARGAEFVPLLAAASQTVGGHLLVGMNLDGPRPGTFQNALVLVTPDGDVGERYVKRHLVPFGEYVPWRFLLGDFPPLRQVPRDGLPGEGPQTIDAAGARVAAVICFETLFADVVRDNVLGTGGEPAGLLVAATNDASFGRGAEPDQHLAQSQLRAVETGRWVVHAALSGRSAFVDPHGRVHQVTGAFEQASIRREVPEVTGLTPYLRIGDIVGITAQILLLLALMDTVRRVVRRRDRPEGP